MKCYLAGPMSSIPDENHSTFIAGAAALRSAGWTVLSPVEHGTPGMDIHDYFRWDIDAIFNTDVVVVLRDWQLSKGALVEVAIAQYIGHPVWSLHRALTHAPGIHHG